MGYTDVSPSELTRVGERLLAMEAATEEFEADADPYAAPASAPHYTTATAADAVPPSRSHTQGRSASAAEADGGGGQEDEAEESEAEGVAEVMNSMDTVLRMAGARGAVRHQPPPPFVNNNGDGYSPSAPPAGHKPAEGFAASSAAAAAFLADGGSFGSRSPPRNSATAVGGGSRAHAIPHGNHTHTAAAAKSAVRSGGGGGGGVGGRPHPHAASLAAPPSLEERALRIVQSQQKVGRGAGVAARGATAQQQQRRRPQSAAPTTHRRYADPYNNNNSSSAAPAPSIVNARGEYRHQQRFKPYAGLERRIGAMEERERALEEERIAYAEAVGAREERRGGLGFEEGGEGGLYAHDYPPYSSHHNPHNPQQQQQQRNITFADENDYRRPLTAPSAAASGLGGGGHVRARPFVHTASTGGGVPQRRPLTAASAAAGPNAAVPSRERGTAKTKAPPRQHGGIGSDPFGPTFIAGAAAADAGPLPYGDVRRNDSLLAPHPFLTRHASNVIYSYTDNVRYRSASMPAGGGVHRRAQPSGRPASDVVARGRAMRQQWARDAFLTQQGRKEDRWDVRRSMISIPPQ